jgi:hypothetical protein
MRGADAFYDTSALNHVVRTEHGVTHTLHARLYAAGAAASEPRAGRRR